MTRPYSECPKCKGNMEVQEGEDLWSAEAAEISKCEKCGYKIKEYYEIEATHSYSVEAETEEELDTLPDRNIWGR